MDTNTGAIICCKAVLLSICCVDLLMQAYSLQYTVQSNAASAIVA